MPLIGLRRGIERLEALPFTPWSATGLAIAVGATRYLFEVMLTGLVTENYVGTLIVTFVFYWQTFFLFALLAAWLVPQPWQRSANVVALGLPIAVLPPVIDMAVNGYGKVAYGKAFFYSYMPSFPSGWPWHLYAPAKGLPLGEAMGMWLGILGATAYVALKTRSAWRSLGALAGAYGIYVWGAGILARLVDEVARLLHRSARTQDLPVAQLLSVLCIYLVLRPGVAKGLLPRTLHALPFVTMVFFGACVQGGFSGLTFVHAAVVFIACLAALVQNDFFDRKEDSLQGRPAYADASDVAFFNALLVFSVLLLSTTGTLVTAPVLVFGLAAVAYNYPPWRLKAVFPANLAMEGVTAACAYLVGVIGLAEVQTFEFTAVGQWRIAGSVPPFPSMVSGTTMIGLLLVFFGWPLVATLKDYKDWEADQKAGVSTALTLLVERGHDAKHVIRALVVVAALCVFVPAAYLAALHRGGALQIGLGIISALLSCVVFALPGRAGAFRIFLSVTAVYLGTLAFSTGKPIHARVVRRDAAIASPTVPGTAYDTVRVAAAQKRGRAYLKGAIRRGEDVLLCVAKTGAACPVPTAARPMTAYFLSRALDIDTDAESIRPVVESLQAAMSPEGLWAYAPGAPLDADDSAFAVLALRAWHASPSADGLLKFFDPRAGLFRTFLGAPSDANAFVTERDLSTANNSRVHPEVLANVYRALVGTSLQNRVRTRALDEVQRKDGTWMAYFYPSDFYGAYQAVSLAHELGSCGPGCRRALDMFRRKQHADGSWGDPGNPLDTAYAVISFGSDPEFETERARGVGYLLDVQEPSGRWSFDGVFWEYTIGSREQALWEGFDQHGVVTTSLAVAALADPRAPAR